MRLPITEGFDSTLIQEEWVAAYPMDNSQQTPDNKPIWFAAHTKPRCEKKLVAWCQLEELGCQLPTYSSVRKYRGKEVTFHKPLFPGYVFLKISRLLRRKVLQSDYLANLLEPPDQAEFEEQLGSILSALETMEEIWLVPNIGPGTRVLIQRGPLAGVEAWVEERHGSGTALLRLDFIGQAAAVKVPVEDLELA
jgi:transcription antitermination factor NusG